MDDADGEELDDTANRPEAEVRSAKRNRARKAAAAIRRGREILAEAGRALDDRTRILWQTDAPELVGAALGVGVGVAAGAGILGLAAGDLTGAAAITAGLAGAGAIVGGGMLIGIAVVAAPAVGLGLGSYWALNRIKKSRSAERHRAELQEAIRKRDAILRELQSQNATNTSRLEYLQQLLRQLQLLIEGLCAELKVPLPLAA